jgi:hypothetical protein
MNTLPQLTEAQIQQQIIGFLRFQGFYVQRLNSGMLPMGEGASRRMIRMTKAGTPDLMAFRSIHEKILLTAPGQRSIERTRVQLVFIEVKRPGKKPTMLQSQVMAELEEHGALCMVATSIEDIERQLAL